MATALTDRQAQIVKEHAEKKASIQRQLDIERRKLSVNSKSLSELQKQRDKLAPKVATLRPTERMRLWSASRSAAS